MATLDDVVKAVKEGNEGTATQQAKEAEATAERKVYDNQVLATLSSISEAIKGITPFKIAEKDSSSFLGKILTSFGLIGAGAAGLAAGLAAGWVVYVGALIKDIDNKNILQKKNENLSDKILQQNCKNLLFFLQKTSYKV